MNVNEPQQTLGLNIPGLRPKEHRATPHPSARSTLSPSNRLPFLGFLPDGFRNHFVAMSGEFASTFLFLFFALSGTQVANTKDPTAHVTLGMCLVGAVPWARGAFLTFSQILGGIASSAVVNVLFPGPLNVRTALLPGMSISQGLFIEMFLSAQLVFTIFMLAAEKHKSTVVAPIGIGLSLFIAEMTGVYYTGGSVNPARSFGPCVIQRQIYWIGPILGSLIAAGFYKFVKMLEYETENPGRDFDDKEQEMFDPSKHTSEPVVDFTSNGSAYIADGARLFAHVPHPECQAPHLRQRPGSEQSSEPPQSSAMRGEVAFGGHGGFVSVEMPQSDMLYQRRPGVERGRIMPREAGRV
ncbi:MAG: hypothetical protein Q9207_003120 [Kuettlingeria erythrocarpa]